MRRYTPPLPVLARRTGLSVWRDLPRAGPAGRRGGRRALGGGGAPSAAYDSIRGANQLYDVIHLFPSPVKENRVHFDKTCRKESTVHVKEILERGQKESPPSKESKKGATGIHIRTSGWGV